MRLKRDSAGSDAAPGEILGALPAWGLAPLGDHFVVHLDGDAVAFDEDVFREPLVVLGYLGGVVGDLIEAPGEPRIGRIGIVYLHLEPFRRPAGLLLFSLNIDAAIRLWQRQNIHFKLEVLERVLVEAAGVKAVAARAMRHDGAVLHRESVSVFASLPPRQVLA